MPTDQFGRGNIFAMIRDLVNNESYILPFAGVPVDGTSGTFSGFAGIGTLLLDTTNGTLYINGNTKASPTWNNVQAIIASEISLAEGLMLLGNNPGVAVTVDASAGGNILVGNDTTMVVLDASGSAQMLVGDGTTIASVAVSGDIAITTAGAVTIASDFARVAEGTIAAADIIGTGAGQLGHSDGVILVAAGGADVLNIFESAVLIMDFDTAAYTAGGNTTIDIGGGGIVLSSVATAAQFITLAQDGIIELVPLAAVLQIYTLNNPLNLVSASAPTDPGTAVGVIRYKIKYRTVTAGL